jgi:hypothetical protein
MRLDRGRTRLFLVCLVPRLALAIVFSAVGYLGTGGDATVYHVLGMHARDLVLAPETANLGALVDRWWVDDQPLEAQYSHVLFQAAEPFAVSSLNTTFPIVALHALVYAVVPHHFAFVAVTSVLSAFATASLVSAFALRGALRWAAILNPASIYFAATHYKESISEALVVFVLIALFASPRVRARAALSLGTILVLFRPSYVPVLVALASMRLLRRVESRALLLGTFVLLMVMPSQQWVVGEQAAGALFSLVYANEATQRVLGTIVGTLAPFPVLIDAGTPFGWMMLATGMLYWPLLGASIALVLRRQQIPDLLRGGLVLTMLIGYFVVGGLAAKTRFLAPFLPALIAGLGLAGMQGVVFVLWQRRLRLTIARPPEATAGQP